MMNRLRRSFRESFRLKKKDRLPESSQPHQWIDDEKSVRNGDCSFPVKYLGNVEVSDARGMQVCEEAMNILRLSRRKPIKSRLHVSGDGLRVVDDEKRGLIVDQTIEKVSFCAPDRQNDKGFSYICRDGTTRRWVLHGFHAVKDSGERLSHAVGCAFAICLEKKQKRDRDLELARSSSSASQQVITTSKSTSPFQRNSSFRQSSIRERMKDPQGVKPEVSKPPSKPVVNPYAIERPHATPQLLERQGSFRAFTGLSSASPFKRQLSLRLNELPSNIERQGRSSFSSNGISNNKNLHNNVKNCTEYSKNQFDTFKLTDDTIVSSTSDNNLSPFTSTLNGNLTTGVHLNDNDAEEKNESFSQYLSSITDMCKELTQGLALLSNDESDDFKSNYPPLKDSSSYLTDSTDSHYITAFETCDTFTTTDRGTAKQGTNSTFSRVSNNNDAIGHSIDKSQLHLTPQRVNFTSPVVTTSFNINCLPTATVAPLISPAVVTTLSSSNVTRNTPCTKKQSTPQSKRIPSISSSGCHLNRRPVPPPPVFNESPSINSNQSTTIQPKSSTFRSHFTGNSVDLSKVWPTSITDPFDAEWTNLVTKNISLNGNTSPLHKHQAKHLLNTDHALKLNNETVTQLFTSDSSSITPTSNGLTQVNFTTKSLSSDKNHLISTNPFASTDPSIETSNLRKEFQVDM